MCHVLIIEDEWLIAEYLTYLVEQSGATSIETACTEEEAVQMAVDRVPDVIMSDIILLAGSGPGAVQRICAILGDIPVMFITATPTAFAPCEKANIVLPKPVDPARVMDVFKQLAAV